jgi:hypothetical protein
MVNEGPSYPWPMIVAVTDGLYMQPLFLTMNSCAFILEYT